MYLNKSDLGSYKNEESSLFIDQCAKKVVSDSRGLVDFAIGRSDFYY